MKIPIALFASLLTSVGKFYLPTLPYDHKMRMHSTSKGPLFGSHPFTKGYLWFGSRVGALSTP